MSAAASTKAIIVRQLNDMPVGQRAQDGYIHATAMCHVAGKLWAHYRERPATQAFLEELAGDIGIPITLLVLSVRGGRKDEQGTWVHPYVAVNLAQWLSPKFAVQVSRWVVEWAITGDNPMHRMPLLMLYNNEPLQKAMSISYHGYLSRINGNFAHQNAELCQVHSDWHWLPSQYIRWAKRQQWPSKHRCSGLAVLRRKEPPSVGAITAEKWALMSGADAPKARAIAMAFKTVGQLCMEAGISSLEMQAEAPLAERQPQAPRIEGEVIEELQYDE